MNARIKELAIKVAGDYSKDDYWSFFNEELEKFAELIVKECGRVADQWVNDEDNGTNLVSEKLKQHFGVKE